MTKVQKTYKMYNEDLQTIIEALKTQSAYNYKNGINNSTTSKTLKSMETIRSTMIENKKQMLDDEFVLTINVVGY